MSVVCVDENFAYAIASSANRTLKIVGVNPGKYNASNTNWGAFPQIKLVYAGPTAPYNGFGVSDNAHAIVEIADNAFNHSANQNPFTEGPLALTSNIVRIGANAFNSVKITGVLTIPSSVLHVGDQAFSNMLIDEIVFENETNSDLLGGVVDSTRVSSKNKAGRTAADTVLNTLKVTKANPTMTGVTTIPNAVISNATIINATVTTENVTTGALVSASIANLVAGGAASFSGNVSVSGQWNYTVQPKYNTVGLATQSYVDSKISLIDGNTASLTSTMNTLNKIASAIGGDPNFGLHVSQSQSNIAQSTAIDALLRTSQIVSLSSSLSTATVSLQTVDASIAAGIGSGSTARSSQIGSLSSSLSSATVSLQTVDASIAAGIGSGSTARNSQISSLSSTLSTLVSERQANDISISSGIASAVSRRSLDVGSTSTALVNGGATLQSTDASLSSGIVSASTGRSGAVSSVSVMLSSAVPSLQTMDNAFLNALGSHTSNRVSEVTSLTTVRTSHVSALQAVKSTILPQISGGGLNQDGRTSTVFNLLGINVGESLMCVMGSGTFATNDKITIVYSATDYLRGTVTGVSGSNVTFTVTSKATSAVETQIHSTTGSFGASGVLKNGIGNYIAPISPTPSFTNSSNYVVTTMSASQLRATSASASFYMNLLDGSNTILDSSAQTPYYTTPFDYWGVFKSAFVPQNSTLKQQFVFTGGINVRLSFDVAGAAYTTMKGYAVPYSFGVVQIELPGTAESARISAVNSLSAGVASMLTSQLTANTSISSAIFNASSARSSAITSLSTHASASVSSLQSVSTALSNTQSTAVSDRITNVASLSNALYGNMSSLTSVNVSNSNRLSTEIVNRSVQLINAVNSLVNGAPSALDTLGKIANALTTGPSMYSTISNTDAALTSNVNARSSQMASLSGALSSSTLSLQTVDASLLSTNASNTSARSSQIVSLSGALSSSTLSLHTVDASLLSTNASNTSARSSQIVSLSGALSSSTLSLHTVDASLLSTNASNTSARSSQIVSLSNSIVGFVSTQVSFSGSLSSAISDATSTRIREISSLSSSLSTLATTLTGADTSLGNAFTSLSNGTQLSTLANLTEVDASVAGIMGLSTISALDTLGKIASAINLQPDIGTVIVSMTNAKGDASTISSISAAATSCATQFSLSQLADAAGLKVSVSTTTSLQSVISGLSTSFGTLQSEVNSITSSTVINSVVTADMVKTTRDLDELYVKNGFVNPNGSINYKINHLADPVINPGSSPSLAFAIDGNHQITAIRQVAAVRFDSLQTTMKYTSRGVEFTTSSSAFTNRVYTFSIESSSIEDYNSNATAIVVTGQETSLRLAPANALTIPKLALSSYTYAAPTVQTPYAATTWNEATGKISQVLRFNFELGVQKIYVNDIYGSLHDVAGTTEKVVTLEYYPDAGGTITVYALNSTSKLRSPSLTLSNVYTNYPQYSAPVLVGGTKTITLSGSTCTYSATFSSDANVVEVHAYNSGTSTYSKVQDLTPATANQFSVSITYDVSRIGQPLFKLRAATSASKRASDFSTVVLCEAFTFPPAVISSNLTYTNLNTTPKSFSVSVIYAVHPMATVVQVINAGTGAVLVTPNPAVSNGSVAFTFNFTEAQAISGMSFYVKTNTNSVGLESSSAAQVVTSQHDVPVLVADTKVITLSGSTYTHTANYTSASTAGINVYDSTGTTLLQTVTTPGSGTFTVSATYDASKIGQTAFRLSSNAISTMRESALITVVGEDIQVHYEPTRAGNAIYGTSGSNYTAELEYSTGYSASRRVDNLIVLKSDGSALPSGASYVQSIISTVGSTRFFRLTVTFTDAVSPLNIMVVAAANMYGKQSSGFPHKLLGQHAAPVISGTVSYTTVSAGSYTANMTHTVVSAVTAVQVRKASDGTVISGATASVSGTTATIAVPLTDAIAPLNVVIVALANANGRESAVSATQTLLGQYDAPVIVAGTKVLSVSKFFSYSNATTTFPYTLSNFPVLGSLSSWDMSVNFRSTGKEGFFRAIVGAHEYSPGARGWGIWINNNNRIQWAWLTWTINPDISTSIIVSTNVNYYLKITKTTTTIQFVLTNLDDSTMQSQTINHSNATIGTVGTVTMGGWIYNTSDNFVGIISNVDVGPYTYTYTANYTSASTTGVNVYDAAGTTLLQTITGTSPFTVVQTYDATKIGQTAFRLSSNMISTMRESALITVSGEDIPVHPTPLVSSGGITYGTSGSDHTAQLDYTAHHRVDNLTVLKSDLTPLPAAASFTQSILSTVGTTRTFRVMVTYSNAVAPLTIVVIGLTNTYGKQSAASASQSLLGQHAAPVISGTVSYTTVSAGSYTANMTHTVVSAVTAVQVRKASDGTVISGATASVSGTTATIAVPFTDAIAPLNVVIVALANANGRESAASASQTLLGQHAAPVIVDGTKVITLSGSTYTHTANYTSASTSGIKVYDAAGTTLLQTVTTPGSGTFTVNATYDASKIGQTAFRLSSNAISTMRESALITVVGEDIPVHATPVISGGITYGTSGSDNTAQMNYTVSSVVDTVTVLKPDGSALPTGASFTQSIVSTTGASRVISVIVTFTNAVAPLSVAVFAELNASGKRSAASASQTLLGQYAAPVISGTVSYATVSAGSYTANMTHTVVSAVTAVQVRKASDGTVISGATASVSGTTATIAVPFTDAIAPLNVVIVALANANGRESAVSASQTLLGQYSAPVIVAGTKVVMTSMISTPLFTISSSTSFPTRSYVQNAAMVLSNFPALDSLTQWKININFNAQTQNTWRPLIGSMYYINGSGKDWGVLISDTNKIYWTFNLNQFATNLSVSQNVNYQLTIARTTGNLTFVLKNADNSTSATFSNNFVEGGNSMTYSGHSVTLGGWSTSTSSQTEYGNGGGGGGEAMFFGTISLAQVTVDSAGYTHTANYTSASTSGIKVYDAAGTTLLQTVTTPGSGTFTVSATYDASKIGQTAFRLSSNAISTMRESALITVVGEDIPVHATPVISGGITYGTSGSDNTAQMNHTVSSVVDTVTVLKPDGSALPTGASFTQSIVSTTGASRVISVIVTFTNAVAPLSVAVFAELNAYGKRSAASASQTLLGQYSAPVIVAGTKVISTSIQMFPVYTTGAINTNNSFIPSNVSMTNSANYPVMLSVTFNLSSSGSAGCIIGKYLLGGSSDYFIYWDITPFGNGVGVVFRMATGSGTQTSNTNISGDTLLNGVDYTLSMKRTNDTSLTFKIVNASTNAVVCADQTYTFSSTRLNNYLITDAGLSIGYANSVYAEIYYSVMQLVGYVKNVKIEKNMQVLNYTANYTSASTTGVNVYDATGTPVIQTITGTSPFTVTRTYDASKIGQTAFRLSSNAISTMRESALINVVGEDIPVHATPVISGGITYGTSGSDNTAQMNHTVSSVVDTVTVLKPDGSALPTGASFTQSIVSTTGASRVISVIVTFTNAVAPLSVAVFAELNASGKRSAASASQTLLGQYAAPVISGTVSYTTVSAGSYTANMTHTVVSAVTAVQVRKASDGTVISGATASVSGTTATIAVPFTDAIAPLNVVIVALANANGRESAASASQSLLGQYAAPVIVAGTKVITLSGSTYTHTANYTSASTSGIKVYDAAGTTLIQTVTTPGSGTFAVTRTYDASKIGQTAFVLSSNADSTNRESAALTVVGEDIPVHATPVISGSITYGTSGSDNTAQMNYTVSSMVDMVTVLKPDGSALPTGASFTQSIVSTTGASRVISVIVTFTNAVAPLSVAVFAELNASGKRSAASASQTLLGQYAAPVSVAGTKVITLSGSTYTHTANYTSASTAGINVYDAAGTTLLQTVTTPGSGTFTVTRTYDASKIGQTAFVLKSAANATGRESVALTVVGENIPPPAIVRAGTVPTVTLSTLQTFGSNGSSNGLFSTPRGIATDATGNIYVADSGNHRIQKFDSNGNYLSQFGQRGSSYGDFEGPRGIAIDAAGNIYVVDAGNYRIQIFTNAGSHIRTIYGTGGDPQRLLGPRGIAIDAAGNIYVTDPSLESNRNIIRVFNSTGGYIRSFGPTGSADGYLYGADGIAIDATGNIYVADTTNNRVQKFDSNGNYLAKFGSYGVDNGQFDRPTGIAIDASGKIIVADGSNRIQTFTNAGIFVVNSFGSYQAYSSPKLIGIAINASGQILVSDINNGDYRVQIIGVLPPAIARAGTLPSGTLGTLSTFGSLGTDNGQLAYPYGVATDAAGNIYVAESDNHRIQKFNSAGTHVSSFGSQGTGNGQFNAPRGIAIGADGNIYVADTDNNRIQMFTSTGTHVSSFGTGGTGNGQFNTPTGIAIDATGNIYVADTNNNRIQMFTSTGTHVSSFGTGGTGNGQFNTPTGIAIDATGNIYVADTGNHRIQMFTSTGTHVSSFGSVGTGNGQFNTPRGIAIDASGKFVVADTMNHRIQLFTSARTHVSSFGSFGTGNGQFNRALGIAINASGKILVVDQNNHRVQIVVIAEFDLGGGAIVDGAYLIPMPNGAKNSYGTTWDEPGGHVFVYSANNYNTGSHVIGANIAMSADGTQMVVGSPFFDGSSYVASSNYGIIQILGFNSSGTSWTLNGSDSGGANNYKLGEQVAISGDGKVVAATVNVGVGQIKLYKNGSNYATLSGATYSVFSGFGMALSLSGNGRWLALSGNSVTTQNTSYLPGYIKVINISDGTYSQWGQDILGPDSTNAVLGSQLIISADGKKLIASTGNYSYGGNSNYNKIVVHAKPSTTSGSWNNIWVKENYDIILGRQRDLSASYDLNIIAFARRISASPHTPTTYIYNTETNTLINSIVRSYSLHSIGEFDLAISGDGKVIAQFETTNSTQYNVYVYDIATLAQIGNTISRTATMGYNCISLSGAGTKIGISIPYGTPANPGGEVSVFHIPRTEYVEYTSSNATFTPVGKTSLIPWEWTTTSGGSATITATQYINGAVNKTWTDTFTVS